MNRKCTPHGHADCGKKMTSHNLSVSAFIIKQQHSCLGKCMWMDETVSPCIICHVWYARYVLYAADGCMQGDADLGRLVGYFPRIRLLLQAADLWGSLAERGLCRGRAACLLPLDVARLALASMAQGHAGTALCAQTTVLCIHRTTNRLLPPALLEACGLQ